MPPRMTTLGWQPGVISRLPVDTFTLRRIPDRRRVGAILDFHLRAFRHCDAEEFGIVGSPAWCWNLYSHARNKRRAVLDRNQGLPNVPPLTDHQWCSCSWHQSRRPCCRLAFCSGRLHQSRGRRIQLRRRFSHGFVPFRPTTPLITCTRSRLAPSGSRSARTMNPGALPSGAALIAPPMGTPRAYPSLAKSGR